MVAGTLVAGFGIAGIYAHPAWGWGTVAVGAGLLFAGATGICAMAHLLQAMPWNR